MSLSKSSQRLVAPWACNVQWHQTPAYQRFSAALWKTRYELNVNTNSAEISGACATETLSSQASFDVYTGGPKRDAIRTYVTKLSEALLEDPLPEHMMTQTQDAVKVSRFGR